MDSGKKEFFKSGVFDVVKMVLIALVFALVLVLFEALVARWASINDFGVTIFNYCIKAVAVVAGAFLGLKQPKNGLLKGTVGGALFTVLAYLLFASLNGFRSTQFSWIDLACISAAGAIAGVVKINLKARKSA